MKRSVLCLLAIMVGLLPQRATAAAREYSFYVYNAANGLADNSAQTINCTKTGRLVITTMGQINFYDGQKFSYIDPTTENTYPLSKYNGHAHLYFDRHHHLWLKKRRSLTCVNLTREKFVDNIVDEFRELGMSDKVEDLFVDGTNTVWLLTAKGLFCTETKKTYPVRKGQPLQDLDVWGEESLMLFYGDGSVDFVSLSSGDVTASERAYTEGVANRYDGTSLVRRVGDMFYQIRNGSGGAVLLRLDPVQRTWETVMETPYYMSSIVEHDSTLFIPSAYGYWTYDLVTGRKEHTERLRMANGQMLLTDINAMEFDRQGGLWVGTEKRGLLYARPYASPFTAYTWSDHQALDYAMQLDRRPEPQTTYRDKTVNCVLHDSRGWDWVGTSTGLQLYRSRSAHLPQLITRHEGLLNNVIHCIVEDQAHHIWVGTSYGICCVVLGSDGKVRFINRYNEWDGVPCESFVNGRSMLLADGTVVMQALDHVVAFNPSRMQTLSDSVEMKIYPKLVRLYVNGNDVRTGDKLGEHVILQRALTRTRDIDLNYNQNSVSLTFSGLNYFRPQQTYYRVRLSGPGMDERWRIYTPYDSQGLVDKSGQLHLPLVSLVPGTYSIEVQASMLPDDWDTTPYEWYIHINEPWWRTKGVIALLGLLVLVLFCIYVYIYLRNANLRARRNSEEQGIIKRIRAFAERCDRRDGYVLEPSVDEATSRSFGSMADFSPEFVEMMPKVVPLVLSKGVRRLTMRELSAAAGTDLQHFYELISKNIYKNPRPIAMQMMLAKAANLLLKDREMDLEDIAAQCGFVTPNYFIASFFHQYHMTPEAYRLKSPNSL